MRLIFFSAVLLFFVSCNNTQDSKDQLGEVRIDVSGTSKAKSLFEKGLLLLHSFEYEDAREAFQEAQEIDPEMPMAYWGEALTHYRMLWNEIELDKAREVLGQLGDSAQERAERAGSDREKAYLAALDVLLEGEDNSARAARYAEALERLTADYPEDENAAAFYALALLGSSGADRDFTIYMKSAAVSEGVFAKNPEHPGAVHYLIHAYDDPVHAPLGLRPALAYAQIAPAATHALHMPSHIFFPLGMWEDATAINRRSYAAGLAWGKNNGKPINGGGAHALTWLIYSENQQGKYLAARLHLEEFKAIVDTDPSRLGQFTEAWASYLFETGFADSTFTGLDLNVDKMKARNAAMYHFARSAAAIHSGNLDAARVSVDALANVKLKLDDANWSEKAQPVMLLQLKAMIASVNGEPAEQQRLLTEAADMEYNMPRRFGPPWPAQSSHELLGELLMDLGDNEGAQQVFTQGLELAKGRSRGVLGLARASLALGQTDKARRAYQVLAENWAHADTDFPERAEATEYSR